jgi:hypothetical protein
MFDQMLGSIPVENLYLEELLRKARSRKRREKLGMKILKDKTGYTIVELLVVVASTLVCVVIGVVVHFLIKFW